MLEGRWDCSAETVHRVIARANSPEHNVPIHYDRRKECYVLESGKVTELPGVWFSSDEMAALFGLSHWLDVLGSGVLKEKLDPVRDRLESMLKERGLGAMDWKDRIRLLPMQARALHPDVLTDATRGALQRKRVAFMYQGARESEYRLRQVSPQTLVRYRDNWYLDAWCHERRGLRQFSLSRMKDFRVLPDAAKELAREKLDSHFADAYGIFAGPARHKARLVFEGAAARIVSEERWHPKQRLSYLAGGKIRLEFPCCDVRELARDVMRFADEVMVVGPETLREAVAGMVNRAGVRNGEMGKGRTGK